MGTRYAATLGQSPGAARIYIYIYIYILYIYSYIVIHRTHDTLMGQSLLLLESSAVGNEYVRSKIAEAQSDETHIEWRWGSENFPFRQVLTGVGKCPN